MTTASFSETANDTLAVETLSEELSEEKNNKTLPLPGWVHIGKIMGTHGLEGQLRLKPNNPSPDWLDSVNTLWLEPFTRMKEPLPVDAPGHPLEVRSVELQSPGRVLVLLKGLSTPEKAALWVGSKVWIPEKELPVIEEKNTFRTNELVGLQASLASEAKMVIGEITAVVSAQGNAYDFLELTLKETGQSTLIPFLERFIPEVSRSKGIVLIEGLDSLLMELNTAPLKIPKRQRRKNPKKPEQ